MNSEQAKSLGRSALKFAGGALVMWAASKGYIDTNSATNPLITIAAGGSGAVLTALGAWWSNRKHAS
jgi:hypothetical protein